MHTVRLLSQQQVNDQSSMRKMFSLITSKHVYSVSKQKPTTSSDIYDIDSHSDCKPQLNSVKIGDPVRLRTNRYATSAPAASTPATKTKTLSSSSSRSSSGGSSSVLLVKREIKSETSSYDEPVHEEAKGAKPQAKKGSIASLFANAKPKQQQPQSSASVVIKSEPMDDVVDDGQVHERVVVKKEPVGKKTTTKKNSTAKKTSTTATAAKKKRKQIVDSDSDDDDDDGNGSNNQLILDEEDEEMSATYVPSTLTSGLDNNDDYVPSDSDEEMESVSPQTTRRSSRLQGKNTPEKSSHSPGGAKSPSTSTDTQVKPVKVEKPNATLEQFGASPVKATGPRRTKQVKKRVMKPDEKGYMCATFEWVEEEMTEQEIKEEEEREKKRKEKLAAQEAAKTSTAKKPKKKAAAGGNIASYFTKK